MRIGLQPLGTVDSLVSSIPLIGNILTGKEKSLIVYSLEVTGSLSNPQVKNVPFKNIGESALGYLGTDGVYAGSHPEIPDVPEGSAAAGAGLSRRI